MKASKAEIIVSQEVGLQDVRKGNSYILDTPIMVMDCEESETNTLTNKSSMPDNENSFSLRYY